MDLRALEGIQSAFRKPRNDPTPSDASSNAGSSNPPHKRLLEKQPAYPNVLEAHSRRRTLQRQPAYIDINLANSLSSVPPKMRGSYSTTYQSVESSRSDSPLFRPVDPHRGPLKRDRDDASEDSPTASTSAKRQKLSRSPSLEYYLTPHHITPPTIGLSNHIANPIKEQHDAMEDLPARRPGFFQTVMLPNPQVPSPRRLSAPATHDLPDADVTQQFRRSSRISNKNKKSTSVS